jgi:hypothetical protein
LSKPLRNIVEDNSFKQAFEVLKISYRRLDDVMAGVCVALATNPELFPKIPDTSLSLVKTRDFPSVPALRIFFTYNATDVHLHYIEIIQSGADDT